MDYSPSAAADEWSGDAGVGALYFSQQCVFRGHPRIGIELPAEATKAEKLKHVQPNLEAGDEGARRIWESIGVFRGYGIAHYADFYDLKHVLILGRVMSGGGGPLILEGAKAVLAAEFPELAARINIQLPDEELPGGQQSIAAASLPAVTHNRSLLRAAARSNPSHTGERLLRAIDLAMTKERAKLYMKNATIYTPDHVIEDGAVLVDACRIGVVGPAGSVPCPAEAQVIDASGLDPAPGLFNSSSTARSVMILPMIRRRSGGWPRKLPRYGVTSFLPTLITSPLEKIARGQKVVTEGWPAGLPGRAAVGLARRGPVSEPSQEGAHNPRYLRLPDLEAVAGWTPETGVRPVTLAPELPGVLDLIRALSDRGVLVSAGHSMATYDQAEAGFDAGARYGTHLFNAMPALGHRDPGLPGALLTDDRVIVGLIADGIHTHPSVIKLVWQALGGERLNLVTDAMAALGMAAGKQVAGRLRGDGGCHQCPSGRRHAGGQHPVAGSSPAQPGQPHRLLAG